MPVNKKKFVLMFWFVSWTDISLGLTINLSLPNLELHIPFGFIKIGWEPDNGRPLNWETVKHRQKALVGGYK